MATDHPAPWLRSRSHVLDTTADTGLVDLLAAPALAVSLKGLIAL